MKIARIRIILLSIIIMSPLLVTGQVSIRNSNERNTLLKSLAGNNKSICSMTTIGKSSSGLEINVFTIGKGDKESKPGVAIIGGIDNSHLIGSEIATGFALKIIKSANDPQISSLLDQVTFYIFPDINPDASIQFFAVPSYETGANSDPWDNDRDFQIDEDPFEDLNHDGMITLMRVSDQTGMYTVSEKDDRIMKLADISRGEKGGWNVYTEGIDNDKDGKFNEDGNGGVNINNNFSFEYEEWGGDAGLNAVSENETRAVADFLFDHYNIYTVLIFGPDDNLGKPWKSSPNTVTAAQSSQIINTIQPEDENINKLVSDLFIEATGHKGTPYYDRKPGNIADWAYYHYGRYTFATPGWWISSEKDMTPEESYLKWANENSIEGGFVDWTTIDHPDFPGKKVEVGGLKPFLLTTPPDSILSNIIDKNYEFIVKLSELHPDPELIDLRVEKVDKDIYRVSVVLHNRSPFATTNQLGDRNVWNRKMVLTINSKEKCEIITGNRKEVIDRLGGNESRTYTWILKGRGEFTLTAGAVNTGFSTLRDVLK